MTVAEWKALGLTAVGKGWPADHLRATLIEADGPGGRAFLTFDNYRALLDYNCSNYYAISVGLLADAISRQHSNWRAARPCGLRRIAANFHCRSDEQRGGTACGSKCKSGWLSVY